MKRIRACVYLALIIAALCGYEYLLGRGESPAAALRQSQLVASIDHVDGIELDRGRGTSSITLKRRDGAWRIESPVKAPVDAEAVARLLDALAFSEPMDKVTAAEIGRNGFTRADYGLEPFPRLLLLLYSDIDSPIESLSFGSDTPAHDGAYLQIGDDRSSVWMAPSNFFAAVDLTLDSLRDHKVFDFGVSEVQGFDFKIGKGQFQRFVRADDSWKMIEPSAAPAASSAIRNLIASLIALRVREFVWPTGADGESRTASVSLLAGYGLDPDSAVTVTLKSCDGRDCTVAFGKVADDGRIYASLRGGEEIVTLDAALVKETADNPSALTDNRLFPFEADKLTSLSLVHEDTTYLIARDENGAWRFDAPVSAPVDTAVLEPLVKRLLLLTGADLAAQDGVEVTVNGDKNSFTVDSAALLDELSLKDLRSRQMLKLDAAEIRRIAVTRADEGEEAKSSAVVFDAERRAWNVDASVRAGAVVADRVNELLAALNPLEAVSVVALKVPIEDIARYGLDHPAVQIAIDRSGEQTVRRNILIGKPTKGGYYATIGASDAVFVISPAVFERLTAEIVEEK